MHAECAPAAPVFTDVPAGHPNQREIEALFQAGLTSGCVAGPPYSYCPASNVNRAEMATFLVLAATPGFTPPPCNVSAFADVNCAADWFAPWVEELYRRGLTGGCAVNPLRYCPASQVTRAEISAFLLRAREGIAYLPPPAATGRRAGWPRPAGGASSPAAPPASARTNRSPAPRWRATSTAASTCRWRSTRKLPATPRSPTIKDC